MHKNWWSIAYKICVLNFGISPKDFWQLSLPEFELLIENFAEKSQEYTPSRSQLENLIQNYPDTKKS